MIATLRRLGAGGVVALAALAARADTVALQLISYEVIPSGLSGIDLGASTYAQREAVTEAALESIAPRIIRAVGIDPTRLRTEVTPGGYLLETNPSLQARGALTDDEATRLAVAFGYVFRQSSVLISQPHDSEGRTGYVVVGFPQGALTPALAQSFFEFAAQTHKGLGGGYTAFGDEMVFLNVRDARDQPYSMLPDMTFSARLGRAAGSFTEAQAKIVDAGFAEARFVVNDWDAAPMGEDYMTQMGDPEVFGALAPLRREHEAMVRRMAAGYGWD